MSCPSPPQAPQLIDVQWQPPPVDRDDQAEADDDLAGGDDHHDHREDLPVGVAEHAAEGDEGEVAGVQHQLEAKQDDQRTAPDQHAARPDGEEQRGEHDVPLGGHQTSASAAGGPCFFPASTTAATAERSRSIEAASKAIRNFSSKSSPMSAGWPKPSGIVGPSSPSPLSEEPSTAIDSSANKAAARRGARTRCPGIGSQTGSWAPPT